MIEKARDFCIAAHDSIDQRRKYTFEPYWTHPERVASTVATITNDEEVITAAWLHDVIEDVAPVSKDYDTKTILNAFGERVLNLVLEVTDVSKPEDGNRAVRKEIDRNHLKNASKEGKLIKLADSIDNTMSIKKDDLKFYNTTFRKEKLALLPVIREGNEQLYNHLKELLKAD